MGLARSTYYDAPTQAADDTALVEAMTAICDAFEAYGWRRVQADLCQLGWRLSHKKVRRLMRAHDRQPRIRAATAGGDPRRWPAEGTSDGPGLARGAAPMKKELVA